MSVIDTLGLRQEWDRESLRQDRQQPFKRWHYVTVEFPVADQDVDIPHPFADEAPETIRYWTVAISPAAIVHRSSQPDRVAWTSKTISLRASAPCRARLILFLERPS